MRIPSIKTKIVQFIHNQRVAREERFLNKYVSINSSLEGDVFEQLHSARKVIANYAKRNGVTVEIADAERRVSEEIFEFDIDERMAKRAAQDNLDVIVRPIKPLKTNNDDNILVAFCKQVKRDVNHVTIHKPDERHEYQDSFLRSIYR